VESNDAAVPVLIPDHLFTDVPAWIDLAVDWIVFHGVGDGYADLTYRPDLQITRAQAMRMLWRLALSVDVAHEHPFTDVPPWVDQAVDWANDPAGPAAPAPLATGFGDGTFRPDEPITRAQFVRTLWRFAGAPASACGPHGLTDVPAWVDPAVSWATCDPDGVGPLEPVATGFADLTFRPDLPISRAEATRMLHRLAAQLDL
jgi:amidase